jgi:hypothetical protein
MKKFVAWTMVLAVGAFVMGCGDTDKKVDKKTTTTTTEKKEEKKDDTK